MSQGGPIGDAVSRARNLQLRYAGVTASLAESLRSSPDAELPRAVASALVRVVDEAAPEPGTGRPGASHWVPFQVLFEPQVLSAATLRAAKVVEGVAGFGSAIAMPRRANDFPDATPFGLLAFYQVCVSRSKQGGASYQGITKLLARQHAFVAEAKGQGGPSLADALLLGLIPDFLSSEKDVGENEGKVHGNLVRDLFEVAGILAASRAGALPTVWPSVRNRLAQDLLETESLHGMLHAAVRVQVGKAAAENWPPLVESYVVRQADKSAVPASGETPLLICALASNWVRFAFRGLSPARRGAVQADFKALVRGCPHGQAPELEAALNRAIA